LKRSLSGLAADPELRQVLWQISREVLFDNRRLNAALARHWRSPEAQRALALAAERLDPAVRRIGRLVFQGDDGGISPEFTRVLRTRLLEKDQRFLVLEQAEPPDPPPAPAEPIVLRVRRGSGDPLNPLATSRSSRSDERLE
jgi:hypothetical protein